MGRGVRGLRLARMPSAERGGVAPSVLAAYDRSIEVLAALGAEIVDITLPFTFSDLLAANAITYAEGYYFNGRLAEDTAVQIDESVRKRILAGREISAQEYLKTKFLQRELKQAFDTEMEEIDALLTPTTETAALLLRDVNEEQAPSRFTRFVNLLELCALALPNGFDEAGLPLSLQIVCRGYDEVMALRIGHCYQQATDWHRPLPPIA
jgi:aspartyl-tRNA(Asn)/glutamyl-tRNA(Gln) amidotransferase subunit A